MNEPRLEWKVVLDWPGLGWKGNKKGCIAASTEDQELSSVSFCFDWIAIPALQERMPAQVKCRSFLPFSSAMT